MIFIFSDSNIGPKTGSSYKGSNGGSHHVTIAFSMLTVEYSITHHDKLPNVAEPHTVCHGSGYDWNNYTSGSDYYHCLLGAAGDGKSHDKHIRQLISQ